jgi:7-keto-8-aminopelargonate synthetase-like enzyme
LRDRLAGYGFDVKESGSQILPVMTGENSLALELARAAWERGVLATAIRPPTVPEGTARVRLSVSLSHSEEDIETAARILAEAASEVGLI